MGYAGNRRIPLAHQLLCLSGIFGVVMSLVNVAMSKWIIDVATGAQKGNIYLVATIVVLSFLSGMGIKLVSPWIFGKINMRISIRMQNSLSDALMMCSWKGAGNGTRETCSPALVVTPPKY